MSDETPAAEIVQRTFTGLPNTALTTLCFLIAVGHIYVAFDPVISEFQRNAYHFAGFAFLASVLHPMIRGKARSKPMLAFDLTFGALVAVAALYLPFAEQGIYDRGVKFTTLDWIAAVI
ncbi:MAG: TRAP transporter permease, partial [Paracoccaceae bacterium]|nr:TRAP transporter permease [Paracoccaceae bacterium]